jgi:hypothetical protein
MPPKQGPLTLMKSADRVPIIRLGFDAHDPEAVVPIDGSTVSHHAIITLAIRFFYSAVASRIHCQASSGGCSKFRRSIVSPFGHDRPSDARNLVGDSNGDELGRILAQQLHDLGVLLRILPGVSNNRCCPDDEQPSKIAISLLGDASEPAPCRPSSAAAAQVREQCKLHREIKAEAEARQ